MAVNKTIFNLYQVYEIINSYPNSGVEKLSFNERRLAFSALKALESNSVNDVNKFDNNKLIAIIEKLKSTTTKQNYLKEKIYSFFSYIITRFHFCVSEKQLIDESKKIKLYIEQMKDLQKKYDKSKYKVMIKKFSLKHYKEMKNFYDKFVEQEDTSITINSRNTNIQKLVSKNEEIKSDIRDIYIKLETIKNKKILNHLDEIKLKYYDESIKVLNDILVNNNELLKLFEVNFKNYDLNKVKKEITSQIKSYAENAKKMSEEDLSKEMKIIEKYENIASKHGVRAFEEYSTESPKRELQTQEVTEEENDWEDIVL